MKPHLLTTAIAFLLGMGIQQNAHADLKDGLVAHWSFDDCRATDNSGNGHDGTINGNPQCVDGVKGKAFSFDGVKDFIEILDDSKLSNFSDIALSVWIYKDNVSSDFQGIITKWYQYSLNETSSVNQDTYALLASDSILGATNNYFNSKTAVTDKDKISLSQWNHIVFVHSNKDGGKLYVNGHLKNTTNTGGNIVPSSNAVILGADNNRGSIWRFFQGKIDETRIYNRALTEAEVLELYSGGGVEEVVKVPEVLKVEPTEAIKNKYTVFTVTGSHLTADNIEFDLDSCVNANRETERTQSTDTKRLFRCMLPTTGEIRGRIYSRLVQVNC